MIEMKSTWVLILTKNYSFLYLLVCSAKSRIVPFFPPQLTSRPETSLLVCRQLNNLIAYTIESFVTFHININTDNGDEIYFNFLNKNTYLFLYLLLCSAKSRIVPFFPPQFTSSPETSLLVCRQINNLISYYIRESFVTAHIINNRDNWDEIYLSFILTKKPIRFNLCLYALLCLKLDHFLYCNLLPVQKLLSQLVGN
jgi:hypothetical protein